MDSIVLTPLKQILNPKGNIFHALKKSDVGFEGFGEAYFSTINHRAIKGWKKHTVMTLNLVVIVGEIEFVIYDEVKDSFFSVKLSPKNYQRLTIPPNYWMAFRGIGKEDNILLNLASIEHDPEESENCNIESIDYGW